ncbi:hypothetical protein FG167_16520 [Lacinutrix sp. WUR7]|uniref:PD-(D/E)XK nuclease family protein n=1 Tax=Lacinutrix sp. WUR7 TaxID=2653681 RepID=UPI00193D77DA|nr:PD-(D/E)XK nuclease family protein [Lacinutrix sp. WUR7]QRM90775.1 hypothetical protein FG167_16520 [Lacinutrix sp. WUR7]
MKELTKRIIAFKNSQSTKKLMDIYSTKSLMEIYGVNRKEIRHTSFLKWLFSKECMVSEVAVGYLIDVLIASKFFNENTIDMELYKKLVLGDYSINSLKVIENFREGINGEIDLIIECNIDEFKLQIIVENKVYSGEFNKQTLRYFDSINNKNNNDINTFFVYLTPISLFELDQLESPECICKDFIQINYQNILDLIITPLFDEDLNDSTFHILKDYIIALRNPVENIKNTHQFMAITKEESDLLTQFWEENKDLIQKAVESLQTNLHVEPSIRDTAKNIADQFKNNNEKEKIGKFVQRKLNELVAGNFINNDEISQMKSQEKSKELFDIQYPLLEDKINSTSPLHYWKDPIEINGNSYWVCCEWFENERNNDRVHFEKWLEKFKKVN